MKKILLIPSILTMAMPLVTLASCKSNENKPKPKEDHAFETCTWEYLNKNCSDLEGGTITKEEFLKAFTLDGEPVTDMDQFIGKTKRVQLKHQDLDHDNDPNDYLNGNEVAQTVRVLGTCNDDDSKYQVNVIDADNTKATFTFEFADLISDANGYSLGTMWIDKATDANNNNYFNTTIRKNVCGLGEGENAHWYLKDGTTHTTDNNYEGKSVLDMLPDDLESSLKSPKNRTINIKTTEWAEQNINDKLFLLSAIEMEPSYTDDREILMKGYKFYTDGGDVDSNRIKRQIKKGDGARDERITITDAQSTKTCYSYAGYDKVVEEFTLDAITWLSSPATNSSNCGHSIDESGMVGAGCDVRCYASTIAPGFCI